MVFVFLCLPSLSTMLFRSIRVVANVRSHSFLSPNNVPVCGVRTPHVLHPPARPPADGGRARFCALAVVAYAVMSMGVRVLN